MSEAENQLNKIRAELHLIQAEYQAAHDAVADKLASQFEPLEKHHETVIDASRQQIRELRDAHNAEFTEQMQEHRDRFDARSIPLAKKARDLQLTIDYHKMMAQKEN
jgi:hypothetical protein